jgi:hypothetical protein
MLRAAPSVLRRAAAAALAAAVGTLAVEGNARAQSTILRPGDRAPYLFELEPHLLATPFNPPGDGTGSGLGAGVRANFEVLHEGFVSSINDSVALSVGADFLHYQGSGPPAPGVCRRYVPGPGGTNVCVEVSQTGGPSNYAFLPVAMQWNFWLARQWSVFGEPAVILYWFDYRTLGAYPALYLGGRFHISDTLTLTLRIGYPTLSLGVSFLL